MSKWYKFLLFIITLITLKCWSMEQEDPISINAAEDREAELNQNAEIKKKLDDLYMDEFVKDQKDIRLYLRLRRKLWAKYGNSQTTTEELSNNKNSSFFEF